MKKNWIFMLGSMIIMLLMGAVTAYADIGPKPSVVVDFTGLKNELYYVTLLSKDKSTGPYSVSDAPLDKTHYHIQDDPEYGLQTWEAFREYEDEDGFYFLEYFQKIEKEQSFRWGYYPPTTFKILLYFPRTNQYAVSEVYERYAFDSYYAVDASKLRLVGIPQSLQITAQKSYDYTWEFLSLVARIAATIAIELLIAWLFKLRSKKTLLFIALTNIVTQTILNILLNFYNYTYGSWAFVLNYIWMELLVFAIEAAAYHFYFKRTLPEDGSEKNIAVPYALTANAVSFAVGMAIAVIIPGIF